jgi:hypothetical protein
MTNKHKGECTFELDGKTYTLRYSTNALCELEAILEMPFNRVLMDFVDGKHSVINARAMFYAGLTEFHKDVSISDAGKLLDGIGLQKGVEKLNEAIGLAFPDSSGSKKKESPPQ